MVHLFAHMERWVLWNGTSGQGSMRPGQRQETLFFLFVTKHVLMRAASCAQVRLPIVRHFVASAGAAALDVRALSTRG